MEMEPVKDNISSHKYFFLVGFSELGELRPFLFIPFSFMFVVSLFANSLLVYVIVSQRSLHLPILPVFFVPHMLLSFLFDWRGISLGACLVQMYFVHLLGAFQSTLLLWMALDRYFAICTPLYYQEQMAFERFLKFVIPLFIRNVFTVLVVVILAGKLPFCLRNVINHCFCEHMALVELACGSTTINSVAALITVFSVPVTDFFLITASYTIIFSSVLSSGKSSAKALHTCVTHIVVMTVSLTIILTAFLSYRIRNSLPTAIRIFFSIMYLLFPSCFNPIIYGIRTTEIRQHILKTLKI
ncbi:olfactory receptor [Sarotherodon galilaeus]